MKNTRGMIIFMTMFLSACNQNPFGKSDGDPTKTPGQETPPPVEQGGEGQQPAGPNFQIIRTQILQANCLKCHSAAGGNKAGVNLETYETVLRNLSSVEAVVADGSMPPRGPLSQELQALFLRWIQLGAPN